MKLEQINPSTKIDYAGAFLISGDAYHADPCSTPSLSSSIAKMLIAKTPRHAWMSHPRLNPEFISAVSENFDMGKAAHALTLNDPQRFVIIHADNYKTSAAKKARDDARQQNKIPILESRWTEVHAMVRSGRAQLSIHEDAQDAFSPGSGTPEVTLIWQEDGVWCRCRLDWLFHAYERRPFYDYKSTGESANPDDWERIFWRLGYDIQCAFYRRGIRAVLGIENPTFDFVVQEVSAPFALSVVGVPSAVVEMADRKVEEALRWWKWCSRTGVWPGYPRRTCSVGVPMWVEQQWLDREERSRLIREGDKEAEFKLAMDWQAPLEGEVK